jgi:hypothetical protein
LEKSPSKSISLTVKLSQEVFEELQIRIPEGERSNFIREAILEKLQKTPKPNKVLEIEKRIQNLEEDLSGIKKFLADLELLTYEKNKINPYMLCGDDIDRKIVEFLIQHEGATTTEISRSIGENRWLVLNRLRKIQQNSEKKYGKPIVQFVAVEKMGKKRAWWINKEIII